MIIRNDEQNFSNYRKVIGRNNIVIYVPTILLPTCIVTSFGHHYKKIH